MPDGQSFLPFRHELVLDWFAGGGGASTGIEAGIGRPIDLAVNHDGAALAVHQANHPDTLHVKSDVFEVDPRAVTKGQPVGLAWFSPDCTFFSKARGGKPFRDPVAAKRRRGLAWVVVKVAGTIRPRVIMLENVEEFQDWGPLGSDGLPQVDRAGFTFRRWVRELEKLGYRVEWRKLRARDYGVPTIRQRLFVIARRDGLPIVWPDPTHGPGLEPYRPAADCIDWSLPCPSIFLSKKEGRKLGVKRPLAAATMRRIARGVVKFVINAERPFIVPVTHGGDSRVHSIDEPLRTITCARRGELALVAPLLANTRNGERKAKGKSPGQKPRVRNLLDSMPTVTAYGSQGALVSAFLAKHYGGHESSGSALGKSFDTVTARDHHALVTSNLVKLKGSCRDGQPVSEPIHTIQAGGNHYAEVRAFLAKFRFDSAGSSLHDPMPTITANSYQKRPGGAPPLGIVTVSGTEYQIVDIGMRMLTPRELFNAQGFPRDYVIDPLVDGKAMTKEKQIALVGNSVCPGMAEALVRANFLHESLYEAAIA